MCHNRTQLVKQCDRLLAVAAITALFFQLCRPHLYLALTLKNTWICTSTHRAIDGGRPSLQDGDCVGRVVVRLPNLKTPPLYKDKFPVRTRMSWRGSRGTAPLTLKLGIGYRWAVNFTPHRLGPRGGHPSEQKAGWTSEEVWAFWEREFAWSCRVWKPSVVTPHKNRINKVR
jgi:hypothetical protein